MNAQDEKQETTQNSAYNPFPEPQTLPSGWDVSALGSTPQTDSNLEEEDSAAS